MSIHLVEKFISRLGKHQTFSFDPQLKLWDQLLLFQQMGSWALRGLWYKLWLGQSKGLVLVGQNVKIRYPHRVKVGKNFIIEDGCEIMALSTEGIQCGDHVTIGAHSTIKPSSYYGRNLGVGLRIGNHSNIGRYSYIGCSGRITIGNNVMMGPRIGMFAENHNFSDIERPMIEQGVTRDEIVIEDNCWIASGSIILAGVKIGHGSIVASGSVVTKEVPPFSIVGGAPARHIRDRRQGQQHAQNLISSLQ